MKLTLVSRTSKRKTAMMAIGESALSFFFSAVRDSQQFHCPRDAATQPQPCNHLFLAFLRRLCYTDSYQTRLNSKHCSGQWEKNITHSIPIIHTEHARAEITNKTLAEKVVFMTIRILSYNILAGGEDRLPLIASVIHHQQPDVVALQEARSRSNAEALAHQLGMSLTLGTAQNTNQDHVVWLSRLPVIHAQNHPFP